jgi:hypothetical protein
MVLGPFANNQLKCTDKIFFIRSHCIQGKRKLAFTVPGNAIYFQKMRREMRKVCGLMRLKQEKNAKLMRT